MRDTELTFLSFFIILIVGLVFSALFRRFRFPWVVTLILGGIVFGPFGFRMFELDATITFLSEIGLVFLMFMAGMETRLSGLKAVWRESALIAAVNGIVPALIGFLIGIVFGLGITVSVLLSIIFMSSSFAVVIPSLEAKGMLHSKIGKVIVASTMFQDIASLIILAVVLQVMNPATFLPFSAFLILFLLAIFMGVIVRWVIPRLRWMLDLENRQREDTDLFERELRLVVAILIGAVIVFQVLGLEAVVGAFFAGLILSEATQSRILESKIRVLAYGIFIPVFFVVVGANTNLQIFAEAQGIFLLAGVVVLGFTIAKYISGWVAARMSGFTSIQSSLIGITSVPQLTIALAVVAVAHRLNLFPPGVTTAIILLSIVTVLVSPMITNRVLDRVKKEYLVPSLAPENTGDEN